MKRSPLKKGTSTLKRSSKLKSSKMQRKSPDPKYLADRQQQREEDYMLYTEIYNERGPYSEVSKEYIGQEVLSIHYHHIIPKSQWKEGRYIKENVIVLTWSEHSTVEGDIYHYEEVNRRRKILKEIYNIS